MTTADSSSVATQRSESSLSRPPQRFAKLFDRKEVRSLSKYLVEHGIDRITPRLLKTGEIIYLDEPEVARFEAPELLNILEGLASENLLTKQLVNPSFNCPDCNSLTSSHSPVCPNCHGTDLLSGTAIQHLSCLNFDFESNFEHRNDSITCPKCQRALLKAGVDYLKPGTFFKCLTCGEFTARALRLYTCDSCQKVFETTKEAAIEVYEYRISRESKEVFAKYLAGVDVAALVQTMKHCGFEVSTSRALKGRSGIDHAFTIVANFSRIEDKSSLVVVDLISGQSRVDVASVISLFGKAVDCRVKNRVLVAVPELDFEAKIFARNYDISFVEVQPNSTTVALNNFQTILEQVSARHQDSVSERHPAAVLSKQAKQAKSRSARKRSSLDIMADILKVINEASSKTEIMACANLSYDQCQKYIPVLEKLALLTESSDDGVHLRFSITDKGREFLSKVSAEFGVIAEGDGTVWNTRRRAQSYGEM